MSNDVFKALYAAGLIAGSVIRALYSRRSRRNRIADDRKTALDSLLLAVGSLGFVAAFLYLLTSRLDFADYGLPTWASWAGVAVFAAALWLLWRAHADLGRNWSPMPQIREGHSLVTSGVYRFVRHPMYAAHWLWGIAQVLLLPNWIAGPAMLLAFIPLYLVRVPREERMMLDHFGREYREYMNRTGRVVPRLRR